MKPHWQIEGIGPIEAAFNYCNNLPNKASEVMLETIDSVARGLRAMKEPPDYFGFCGHFDGNSILGIPVINLPQCCNVTVSGDEDCPFLPLWDGNPDLHDADIRAFQLNYIGD